MCKDYFADWSHFFYSFFTLIKLMKVLVKYKILVICSFLGNSPASEF